MCRYASTVRQTSTNPPARSRSGRPHAGRSARDPDGRARRGCRPRPSGARHRGSRLGGARTRVGALSMAFDLESLAAEQTVRGRFIRNVQRASDLSDDDPRRILVTGLRAFSGRKDLEVY